MWTRREIKEEAKKFLRDNYLKAFLVCLIVAMLTGGASNSSGARYNMNYNYEENFSGFPDMDIYDDYQMPSRFQEGIWTSLSNFFMFSLLPFLFTSSLILAALIGLAIGLLLINPLEVGRAKYFLNGFKDNESQVGDLFKVFTEEGFLNVVVISLIKRIYLTLWTFLLVIPGLVKSYEYKMIPYILAENPRISREEAFQLSKDLTRGEKLDIFILDLSFIGWYILGLMFFGIGVYFVNPYKQASLAKLYERLMEDKGYRNKNYEETIKDDDYIDVEFEELD